MAMVMGLAKEGTASGERDYRGDNSKGDQGRTRSRAELGAGKPKAEPISWTEPAERNEPGICVEPEETKQFGCQAEPVEIKEPGSQAERKRQWN